MRAIRTAIVPILISALLSGCATPGPVLTESVGSIRVGLASAHDQSALTFESVNANARQIDVDRVASRPAPNLVESDFPLALARDDIAAWGNAFSALDAYLAAIQKLVDARQSAATADELDALAGQLRGGAVGLKLPGALTGAFATFAGAIVQARGERTAVDIMRRVDPAFNAVTTAMADAIGADDQTGIRQTIRLYWSGKLANLRAAYASIAADSGATEQRRMLARKFAAAMDARDLQLRNVGALRNAFLALGEAHAAAARGEGGSALFWIGRIGGWLDDVRRRADLAAEDAK